MLPIVQRELQTAARSPRLYRWRTLSGLAVIVAALIAVATQKPGSRNAGNFFEMLSFFAFLLCLAEGLRKTADSISSERREGTLGLLFLSTLSGVDIVLGKLAAAAIRSLSTLLTFVPVLAVTLLVGGTTGGEFWRTILVLVLVLWFSLSLCLCISTFSRKGALSSSLVWLIAICIVPYAGYFFGRAAGTWTAPLSPYQALQLAEDAYFSVDSASYWLGVSSLAVISIISLTISGFVLPHLWQDRAFKPQKSTRLSGPLPPKLTAYRRAMLDANPVKWLMFDPRSHRNFRAFLLAVLLVTIGTCAVSFAVKRWMTGGDFDVEFVVVIIAIGVVILVSCLRVARATSANFAEARANGALELMLSTPLKVRDIISGQWQALRADLQPALLLFVALGVVVLILAISSAEPSAIFYTVKSLVEAVFAVMTTATVGVWMGLKAKSSGRAHFWTIALGLVAPFLICTPTIINQLVIFGIALDKIHFNFRRFVANQYLADPNYFLPPPLPAQPNLPPVVRPPPGASH
ncbi:MAG TPA: ABC transporter permease subunit [Verrucomicrobiae bacterium]